MKKILEINSFNFGSTGKIMMGISDVCKKNGYEVWTACANSRSNRKNNFTNQLRIGHSIFLRLNWYLSYFTGFNGCFSQISTFLFLQKVKKINPDIIHLHNLHNSYINLSMLFGYIKKYNKKVIWTLHDCWAFTGQCPHFQIAKCDKWKTGCFNCPQYKLYPKSFVDKTKTMYKLKKKWFRGVNDLTIVTPSLWLCDLVKKSFLNCYPIKVINNGIDLDIFKPTKSDFRKENNLEDKFVILGCASPFGYRKGYDTFLELSKRLPENFRIVLVGLNDEQLINLPKNIIGIKRTQNQQELASLYAMADVFVNPTREDNFPTTNIEALACGTPAITYNVGGSAEMIDDTCGIGITPQDIDSLEKAIKNVCENKKFLEIDCIKRSKKYNMNEKFEEYVRLYN